MIYEWKLDPGAGRYKHWEKTVMSGNAVLHIEGVPEDNWYRGEIQLGEPTFDPHVLSIYKTEKVDTLEKCQNEVDRYYYSMLLNESITHSKGLTI